MIIVLTTTTITTTTTTTTTIIIIIIIIIIIFVQCQIHQLSMALYIKGKRIKEKNERGKIIGIKLVKILTYLNILII